jgi:catechol 2,3-dioxygenase-like lactoylglutathione lyase family enzyme
MTIKRMEHLGMVVEDLEAAVTFFTQLGLKEIARTTVEGEWVGRIIGLDGVRSEVVYLQTPDGASAIELSKFHSPASEDGRASAPANARGIRHVSFLVDDLDAAVAALRDHGTELVGEVVQYEESFRLCYVRGPEGTLVELAEQLS